MNKPFNFKDFNFKDFALFKTFITPIIITVLFWLGAGGVFALGVVLLIQMIDLMIYFEMFLFPWIPLLLMFIAPFIWRVICEQLLVLFRVHSELKELNKKQ